MTQEELDIIVSKHVRWLCRDTHQLKNNCKRADFSHRDLTGLRMTDALLNNAIFDYANLCETDFCGARLNGASFRFANLALANLSNTDLTGANFSGANLRHCCLDNSNLAGANLLHAYLLQKERSRFGEIIREHIFGYKNTEEGIVITA